jgi:hypothetical protein
VIFSRSSSGRHAKAEERQAKERRRADDRSARRDALLEDLELTGQDQSERAGTPQSAAAAQPARPQLPPGFEGPYDVADAPATVQRLDLGSLLIPAVDGIEIRVQAGEKGAIAQMELVDGANTLQLAAFAAPRTEGIWDEVRQEIRKSLFDDGVGAEEVIGQWGTELRARLRTPDGFNDLRFIGVDGPRWMLRAVLRGPAAIDPSQAALLMACLSGTAVRRGEDARPVREALPLRMPPEMSAAVGAEATAAGASVADADRTRELDPDHARDLQGGSPHVPGRVPPADGVPGHKPSPRPRRDS